MKKILLSAALALGLGTAAVGASVVSATPASAQSFSIRVGDRHHYDRGYHRGYYRHHRYGYYHRPYRYSRYHHRRVCYTRHGHYRCYWR
jgi:hypothetical protein